jgi:hypothetical protein
MDLDIRLETWTPEALAGKTPAQAIAQLFAYVESTAAASLEWYAKRKSTKGRVSRFLRVSAIALGVAGGLTPIVNGVLSQVWIGQAGYALLALAAGLVAGDRYFGVSSGWIRYVTAMQAIQRVLADFRLEWSALLASSEDGAPPDAALVRRCLERARDFQAAVLRITEEETRAWVAEFQSNLSDLEKTLSAQRDRSRAAADAAEKAAQAR